MCLRIWQASPDRCQFNFGSGHVIVLSCIVSPPSQPSPYPNGRNIMTGETREEPLALLPLIVDGISPGEQQVQNKAMPRPRFRKKKKTGIINVFQKMKATEGINSSRVSGLVVNINENRPYQQNKGRRMRVRYVEGREGRLCIIFYHHVALLWNRAGTPFAMTVA